MKNLLTKKQERRFAPYVDTLIYIGGILGPLVTLPQLITILKSESAIGVSLISWSAYMLGAFVWFLYGVVHREWPIIITYFLWVMIDLAIVAAIILYS